MEDKELLAALVASELTGGWRVEPVDLERWLVRVLVDDEGRTRRLTCRTDQELLAAMANDVDAWFAAPASPLNDVASCALVPVVCALVAQRGG